MQRVRTGRHSFRRCVRGCLSVTVRSEGAEDQLSATYKDGLEQRRGRPESRAFTMIYKTVFVDPGPRMLALTLTDCPHERPFCARSVLVFQQRISRLLIHQTGRLSQHHQALNPLYHLHAAHSLLHSLSHPNSQIRGSYQMFQHWLSGVLRGGNQQHSAESGD